jgi:hypothetical protein
MWIKLVTLVNAGTFGNRIPGTMVLARNTFGRRGCLGFGFAVMAYAARYAAILVPVRRGFLCLCRLFVLGLPRLLAYCSTDKQQYGDGRDVDHFFNHDQIHLP